MTAPVPAPIAADRPRRARWPRVVVLLLALLVALLLVVTSAAPWAPPRGTVTAQQVGAGREAVLQLRTSRATPRGSSRVVYGPAELEGIGALATHGFDPDRLDLRVRGGTMTVTASHRLPLGRWLNVALAAHGRSDHFPALRIRIGAIALPPSPSRALIEAARWLAARRGVPLLPLDRMIRDVVIGTDTVAATIRLPNRTAIVDRLNGLAADPVDGAIVTRLYCTLATAQRRHPSADFATQVRRAFVGAPRAPDAVAYNRAAFVALAMLLVDPRAGDLAGAAQAQTAACRIPPVAVTIHGRADLPMHWTLSAALSAGAGGQLARAMGEWKELADSLAKQSTFAVGDPTGFSFVDLSADRSGFGIARAAATPGDAARIAVRLATATPQAILPVSLLGRQDSLPNPDFVRLYGNTDDPRYKAMVAGIDAVLAREAIH